MCLVGEVGRPITSASIATRWLRLGLLATPAPPRSFGCNHRIVPSEVMRDRTGICQLGEQGCPASWLPELPDQRLYAELRSVVVVDAASAARQADGSVSIAPRVC